MASHLTKRHLHLQGRGKGSLKTRQLARLSPEVEKQVWKKKIKSASTYRRTSKRGLATKGMVSGVCDCWRTACKKIQHLRRHMLASYK